jgi:hypothetical protein
VKRVPMDFDAPLKEVWAGYQMPEEIVLPVCAACAGEGYSPTARWLMATFYDHNVTRGLGWRAHLLQADVDVLVAEGRLRHWQRREPTPDNPRTGEWVTVQRTADEVNQANRAGGMLDECAHDGLNAHILVEHRCKLLGADVLCALCGGDGHAGSAEDRERYEDWTPTEPPTGEGWQLWETTSEGSPVSPVFASARELAAWCETGATAFGSMRYTAAQWLESFEGGTTDVDTLLVVSAPRGDDR